MKKGAPGVGVVRIEIHIPGEGWEAHEYEHCPIAEFVTTGKMLKLDPKTGAVSKGDFKTELRCRIRGTICNLGLTAIAPPEFCPLQPFKHRQTVTMRFKLVKQFVREDPDGNVL